MKKKIISLFNLFLSAMLFALPYAWINEFHYDNSSTDKNEFIEVVVEFPEEISLNDLVLYLYNGYDGSIYAQRDLSEFISGERRGAFQFYTWSKSGIQNDIEGMLLTYQDSIVDILAYEGTFTGVDTPGHEEDFPDIGVRETGYGADTNAIYLTGMPGSDWEYGPATPGEVNTGQELSESPCPVELGDFNAVYSEESVLLTWRTESETENRGFILYKNDKDIAFIDGAGTSLMPRNYFYRDTQIETGSVSVYILAEIAYSGEESRIDSLIINIPRGNKFRLGSPYPNPSNPNCMLPILIHDPTEVSIDLHDLSGKRIKHIYQGYLYEAKHNIPVNMQGLASGKYFLKCSIGTQVETVEIIVVK
ncbi:MAG: T9SS type A sorting domain-containing protein [Candidatus Marinimicrobia bacterium]|nr:T9SS type A sorting domain-containing protein [Candidatus Neomarinimicrobiota bacterium]